MESQQTESAVMASPGDGKCPYLAGRPPHGTYKLWPSSLNVCYGQPTGEKRYGHVDKETQARACFGGESVYSACRQYRHAVEFALAPPEFGRTVQPVQPVIERTDTDSLRRVRKRRKKQRRRFPGLKRVLLTSAFLLLLVVTLAAVLVVMLK